MEAEPPSALHLAKVPASGAAKLDFIGTAGSIYTIYASPNLITWQSLAPAAETSPGVFSFTDPDAPDFPTSFYKIAIP